MSVETERTTVATITRRLIPLFFVMYVIAYIDRQNVSFAKLQMADDLHLAESAYGLGASLFFVGYFLFEMPSNLILAKVGARVWFTRIMASWGLVTLLLAFTSSAPMFYALRFLLGVAEAGFFPGVLYMVTTWFTQEHRSRVVGTFMVAASVANALGALLGGALLDMDGLLGLRGWQWVFLVTGAPAVLLAPYVLWRLPNGPASAPWLSQEQKDWLAGRLAEEARGQPAAEHSPWRAILDPRVLTLGVLFFGIPLGVYGLTYWMPTIIKGFGVGNTLNGALNVVPAVVTGVALYVYPRLFPGGRVRGIHVAAPPILAAGCLVLSVVAPSDLLRYVFLCIAAASLGASQPVFWSLPSRFLRGAAAAAGIAAVNSIGNLGGFVAQSVVPAVRDATGSDLAPMIFLAAFLLLTAVIALVFVPRLERADPASRDEA